jgi:hypothetical protein
MTEADEFRQYAKEALQCASKAKDENEKLSFFELASTWAKAAIASRMPLGSLAIGPPRDTDEATSPTRS